MSLSVLHVSPCYAPAYRLGGPVRSLEGLLGALGELGVRVRVVATDGHGPERLDVPRGWTEWNGVPVEYLPRWFAPDVTPRVFTEVLRYARAADVVHVTGLFCAPTVLGLAAARVAGRPAVLSPRGALEPGSLARGRGGIKRAWLRAFEPLLRGATVHVTSEQEAASVCAALGRVEVIVVPNGTDVPPRQDAPRPLRIGALGRLHPSKGYDRLIRAVALLAERGVACELAIAGPRVDAAHVGELERLAHTLDVASRVAFVGEQYGEDKRRFLQSCCVLALPSHGTENFGNAVIEALAHGTPVVASRLTPWSILERERCGLWVDNDPAPLADALAAYLADPARARDDGARGRALVARDYAWPAVARQMSDAYQALRRA